MDSSSTWDIYCQGEKRRYFTTVVCVELGVITK